MYLHIGNDVVINSKNIVGIFDIENTTVSRTGKNFLGKAQKMGQVVYATEDFPKSFLVVKKGKKNIVYISSMSTNVLLRRSNQPKITPTME